MPKGKRKVKLGAAPNKPKAEVLLPSDDDSLNDSSSIASFPGSECRSVCEEGCGEVDEQTQEEMFEEKLMEAIDGATQKSAQGRTDSLESISNAFMKKYIPEFVTDRRMTIIDCVERSLKKGKGLEQAAAAQLAVLLCVQLGTLEDAELVYKELKSILRHVIMDNAASPKARAKCCMTLGLCTFVALGGMEEVLSNMKVLEGVFSASYWKGNGAVPSHPPEICAMHSAALLSWGLLLTLIAPIHVFTMVDSHLSRIPELLESSDVDLRITAGEVIVLFYEIAREHDDNFEVGNTDDLCEKLRQLSTDSHKYRAKKDRKQQRSNFRDFLKALEEKIPPYTRVKFGREILELDSWCRKRQYDAFCEVLRSGMNLHLTQNEIVREVFELGAPITFIPGASKISKFERHMVNTAAFKARTITRGKNRDKRSVIIM